MDIKLKLNKNFTQYIEELGRKYGERFKIMNGFSNSHFNFTDYIENFIQNSTVADTTIDANANSSTHDVRTLLSDMIKPHTKLLSFNKIFSKMEEKYGLTEAKKWLRNEWSGRFYLHDASSAAFMPYCYAYDLDKLVEKGLFFINKFRTEAPKHLTTFNDHVLEFISWASNRTSGAVGLPSYLLYSYYFWYNDVKNGFYLKDPEYYRRQCFQKFIYDLNQPYLRVTECAFSNITIMDRNYLIELFGGREFPNGEYAIDHIDAITEHQKVFMEVVSKIRKETMMTFPVLTFSLLFQDGKFVDEEFARWCNKHNMEWCDSNFYVGNDVTNLSNCCRLISNTSKLNAFINSIGGTSLSIGSVKVNTINLRRIAIESINFTDTHYEKSYDKMQKAREKYLEILRERVDNCVKVLDIVRSVISENIEKGLLPNYTYGLIEIDKQYNTIGITAMYEAIAEFGLINTDEFGNKSYSEEGLEFATEILNLINKLKDSYDFNYSLNVEAVPAERANVVLCQKDNELFKDKFNYFIYSNQWIPLMEKCSLAEKIKLGAKLDKECGGGQISHINLSGDFANEQQAWDLLNYIAKSGVIYFAYNRKISVCADEHAFLSETCPKCGGKAVDTYSRIVGFFVALSTYSKERKEEFNHRKWFDASN
jgi:ribonucleoside-triphosphate reductase